MKQKQVSSIWLQAVLQVQRFSQNWYLDLGVILGRWHNFIPNNIFWSSNLFLKIYLVPMVGLSWGLGTRCQTWLCSNKLSSSCIVSNQFESSSASRMFLASICECMQNGHKYHGVWASSYPVTPRSCGYENVTVTYICRSRIPSHIYAKHQHKKESEHESMWCIIQSTYEHNYKVITRCDTILQEYYITDRLNCEKTKRCTSMNSTKALMSYKRKTREMSRGPRRI